MMRLLLIWIVLGLLAGCDNQSSQHLPAGQCPTEDHIKICIQQRIDYAYAFLTYALTPNIVARPPQPADALCPAIMDELFICRITQARTGVLPKAIKRRTPYPADQCWNIKNPEEEQHWAVCHSRFNEMNSRSGVNLLDIEARFAARYRGPIPPPEEDHYRCPAFYPQQAICAHEGRYMSR